MLTAAPVFRRRAAVMQRQWGASAQAGRMPRVHQPNHDGSARRRPQPFVSGTLKHNRRSCTRKCVYVQVQSSSPVPSPRPSLLFAQMQQRHVTPALLVLCSHDHPSLPPLVRLHVPSNGCNVALGGSWALGAHHMRSWASVASRGVAQAQPEDSRAAQIAAPASQHQATAPQSVQEALLREAAKSRPDVTGKCG